MKKRSEILQFGSGQISWIITIWYETHEHEDGDVELPYEVYVCAFLLICERGVKLSTSKHIEDEMMHIINWATEKAKNIF